MAIHRGFAVPQPRPPNQINATWYHWVLMRWYRCVRIRVRVRVRVRCARMERGKVIGASGNDTTHRGGGPATGRRPHGVVIHQMAPAHVPRSARRRWDREAPSPRASGTRCCAEFSERLRRMLRFPLLTPLARRTLPYAPVQIKGANIVRSGTIVSVTSGLRRLSASVSPSEPGTTCRSRPHYCRGETELRCRL